MTPGCPAWAATVVAVAGCSAAWLRGWPAVRLRRTAGAFLPFTALWLGLVRVRQGSWPCIAYAVIRDWEGADPQRSE
jgi:hypothetical protein